MPAFPDEKAGIFLRPIHSRVRYCANNRWNLLSDEARRGKELTMRTTLQVVVSLLLFIFFFGARSSIIVSGAQNLPSRAGESQATRGRYLVEEVAKCTECHTPRDADNLLDRSRWLQGAPIWIEPVRPVLAWAQFAPPLAGLPGLSDEQMERVLEKAQSANGREIQPPMHLYHLNHGDAQAVIAYLRSLASSTTH